MMEDIQPEDPIYIRVTNAYTKPGHPVAYSTPARVAKFFNIKKNTAKQILEHHEGYTLHREYKQPRYYNPYYVRQRRKQIQGDLIDISSIANENDGIRFLLVLIDIFTKKLWVYPLKDKKKNTMKNTLEEWIQSLRTKPKILMTDLGREFENRPVLTLLRNHRIKWQIALGTLKACFAERVNKTLQILIYKYLTQNETIRYIDVLPKLVETYNKRGHRSLKGMTPNEADRPESGDQIRAINEARFAKIGEKWKAKLPFKVGDLVRLKTLPKKLTSSSRAYAIQFKGEYYRIIRINRNLPIALYYLRDLSAEKNVPGGLYANELVRQRGELWKIEKVLKRKRVRGRVKIYVKWRYWGPKFNEWLWEDETVAIAPGT